MTIVVSVTFHPLPGQTTALLDAIAEHVPAVHAEPGCEIYALHRTAGDEVLLIEKWVCEEAFAAHREGTALQAIVAATRPLSTRNFSVARARPHPVGESPAATI